MLNPTPKVAKVACPQIHSTVGRPRLVQVGDFVKWDDFRGRITDILSIGDKPWLKVATITLGGEVFEQYANPDHITETARTQDMTQAQKLYSDRFLDFEV